MPLEATQQRERAEAQRQREIEFAVDAAKFRSRGQLQRVLSALESWETQKLEFEQTLKELEAKKRALLADTERLDWLSNGFPK